MHVPRSGAPNPFFGVVCGGAVAELTLEAGRELLDIRSRAQSIDLRHFGLDVDAASRSASSSRNADNEST